jgi:hypothetical protein
VVGCSIVSRGEASEEKKPVLTDNELVSVLLLTEHHAMKASLE